MIIEGTVEILVGSDGVGWKAQVRRQRCLKHEIPKITARNIHLRTAPSLTKNKIKCYATLFVGIR